MRESRINLKYLGMMKNKLYGFACLFALFFAVGCEDLEETYDEFAGDGVIRYTGKCSNVSVDPGWERLRVSWRGNIDPHIKSVKITYQSEEDAQPMVKYVEPKDVLGGDDLRDTIYLENLRSNSVYAVKVSNVAFDSTESIVENAYGRPYTETHEDLLTFTRGIINFYPFIMDRDSASVKNRMVVTVGERNRNLKEIYLKYWGTDKKEYTWNVIDHMDKYTGGCQDIMFMLPDDDASATGGIGIDFSKPIVVERRGLLTGCIDTIRFNSSRLTLDEKIWSADFSSLMQRKHGVDWKSKVETEEELYLDYTMRTFQDLLYFPGLKKVILGKNRYMLTDHQENISTTDPYLALVTLYYLNKVQGVQVEVYNEPYFFGGLAEGEEYSYIHLLTTPYPGFPEYGIPGSPAKIDNINWLHEKGMGANLSLMPSIKPLNTKDWELTCSDTTYNGNKPNGVGSLLDGNPATVFEPGVEMEISVITVKMDMKQAQPLHGFKFVQPNMGTIEADALAKDLKYLLSSIKIEVSVDGFNWEKATYDEGATTVGNCIGETTFIDMPLEKRENWRYIRLSMNTNVVGETNSGLPLFSLRIGDLIPYTLQ